MWKLATKDDLDFISKHILTEEVRIASGMSKMSRNNYLEYTRKLLESSEYKTWMLINDGELDQYFTCYNLKTLPYYVIFNFRKIATPSKLFSTFHQKWDDVLNFIVPLKEVDNYYSFYTLRVSARGGQRFMFDRMSSNMKGDLNSFHNRYVTVVEEYIPKNQSSKYETFDKLIFRGVKFEEDVFITKYICKQAYRTNSPKDFQENFLKLEKNVEEKVKQQKGSDV